MVLGLYSWLPFLLSFFVSCSLLETHTGTKQTNNRLGEHLHIAVRTPAWSHGAEWQKRVKSATWFTALRITSYSHVHLTPLYLSVRVCVQSESLTSERKYLQNRVSQLSSELEDAHQTIAALENINVSTVSPTGHACTLQIEDILLYTLLGWLRSLLCLANPFHSFTCNIMKPPHCAHVLTTHVYLFHFSLLYLFEPQHTLIQDDKNSPEPWNQDISLLRCVKAWIH